MNQFSVTDNVVDTTVRTTNGMPALASTASAVVDLFYKATRGLNIVPQFEAAYFADRELALRVAQFIRDVRGGNGERQLYRDILLYLEGANPADAEALLRKTPELGRWDDVLIFKTARLKTVAYTMVGEALRAGDGLCAKWMPRKGVIAEELRAHLQMSPKAYRKTLVNLTKVVETQMCAKDWDSINFSHVPSLAHARYKKAFGRNTTTYGEWVVKLANNESGVKINAGAVYPYDVLKTLLPFSRFDSRISNDELNVIAAQWDAMPNWVGDSVVLPLVDVSGSMNSSVAGGKRGTNSMSCMSVALSLGLYFADKSRGIWKDTFLTFSSTPELVTLRGNIVEKMMQMVRSDWGMSTNLESALALILSTAVSNGTPEADMPKTLLILSDMQFNSCARVDESALRMIARQYETAGYTMPQVVFWNLNSSAGNVPVSFDQVGVALVSGFSPAVASSVLRNAGGQFTPESIVRNTVMVPRYDL